MKKFISLLMVLSLMIGMTTHSFADGDYKREGIHNELLYTIETLDGRTLTQEEFMQHLENHSEQIVRLDNIVEGTYNKAISTKSVGTVKSVTALIAGTWYIPVIGKVVITAAGVIVIGGAVISAGTWLYNQVVDWFTKRAETKAQEKYDDAKEEGSETDDHEVVEDENSLPRDGENPRSSKDLLDKNGELKQRRYYDKNGDADMDIDYKHGGTNHTFPHRHYWKNGKRGNPMPF